MVNVFLVSYDMVCSEIPRRTAF